jgi:hypothetical protein
MNLTRNVGSTLEKLFSVAFAYRSVPLREAICRLDKKLAEWGLLKPKIEIRGLSCQFFFTQLQALINLAAQVYLTANGHELTRIKGSHSRSLASIRDLLSSLALAEAFQTSLNPVLVPN